MKKINALPAVMLIIIIGKVITQQGCRPCSCMVDTTYGGVKAVCPHLELTSIPLSIPLNTTTLVMEGNMLDSQSLASLPALKHLKYLDLSGNNINKIGENAFTDLKLLEVLLLNGNFLSFKNSVFDARFLKPLISLRSLTLHVNSYIFDDNVTYECTYCPNSLQFLKIDCDLCTFGPSFIKLRQLSMLSLHNVVCKILVFDKSFFNHTPHLETLDITACAVKYVRPGLFGSLRKLRKLYMAISLAFGDEFQVFMVITKSLQFSPLEYLSYTTYRTLQSSNDTFSYLQNTSLRELHISSANSPLISRENYRKLPNSLVVLNMTNIQYDYILTEIRNLSSLKTLDLSNIAFNSWRLQDFYVPFLPSSLKTYICRNCRRIRFNYKGKRENIKYFITPNSDRSYFNSDIFKGLPKVEHIDFSNNFLMNIRLVPYSVTYLNLAGNFLQDYLTDDPIRDDYLLQAQNLSNLKTLDLSDNGISNVSINTFQNLLSVKLINLSNNEINSINVSLYGLYNLEVLDLRNNELSTIGERTRKDIAQLPRAKLYLEGNPLICGCDELDSILWIKQYQERINDIQFLQCRLLGEYKTFDHLDQIIDNLRAECTSDILEISVTVCVTISVMTIVACVLLYRHRWKLRYLYYAGRRGYRQRYNREQVDLEEYEYDAFVSYDENDRRFVIDEMMPELEERHGLKLCIHQRDFLPGEVISENIVKSIQNSRKTIVVLSPSFLESTWCEFEFNMARMEGVSRRQDVVLVLLYMDVPMAKLSKDMAMMLKRKCYLEYDHEVFNREVFWSLVKESIETIRPRD